MATTPWWVSSRVVSRSTGLPDRLSPRLGAGWEPEEIPGYRARNGWWPAHLPNHPRCIRPRPSGDRRRVVHLHLRDLYDQVRFGRLRAGRHAARRVWLWPDACSPGSFGLRFEVRDGTIGWRISRHHHGGDLHPDYDRR